MLSLPSIKDSSSRETEVDESICFRCELADTQPDQLAELLAAVQRGCRSSFSQLYLLTRPRLLGIIVRINHDSAEAEELLQEVYAKVWARAGQFDCRIGASIGWLSTIARHSALDQLRRRATCPDIAFPENEVGDPYAGLPSTDVQPQEALTRALFAAAAVRLMSSMPGDQRKCMELAFQDGLTHSEIAVKLGKPVGTVKGLIRRALLVMRSRLADDH